MICPKCTSTNSKIRDKHMFVAFLECKNCGHTWYPKQDKDKEMKQKEEEDLKLDNYSKLFKMIGIYLKNRF